MDAVAETVLDLIVSEAQPAPLLNVVHPRPSPWHEVYANVNEALGAHLPFVPYHEWISKLEALAITATPQDLERIVSLLRRSSHSDTKSLTSAGTSTTRILACHR